MRFTTAFFGFFGSIFFLALLVIIGQSITRVNDDEVCQVLYLDDTQDDTVRVITEAGLYWVGPEKDVRCVSRSTQHITFEHGTTSGLGRPIPVQSSEGVPVTLEVDVEFRIIPDRFSETVLRTGFDDTHQRLMRVARSVIRNVASRYEVNSFLVGTRQNISDEIAASYRTQLNADLIYMNIIKVNMLHIAVNETYETAFQHVEDIQLQQIVAQVRPELVQTEEARLNATQFIARQASRNEAIQLARTNSTQALLEQVRLVTEANTSFQQALILAESDRNVRIIRAETELGSIRASRETRLAEVRRAALQNITLAETERANMEVRERGNLSVAFANRTRDITRAQIERTRRVEELISREINHTLEMFELDLDANTTATELGATGTGDAAESLASLRSRRSEWLMLQESLNLTDRDLASVLLYRELGNADNMTVTLDHPSIPFNLIEGKMPVDSVVPQV
mmetsp:Transcript_4858/g.12481  ORF Transcript_4858/g.12481 Transcript_4858/m.12481 type:complete len:457 (+) Transcript_4858:188-1558(+)